MSSKPNVSLARWADLVGSFVTAPSSGLRDTGFLDATAADADIVNYEINQLYQWALYLNDGALVGDHSIAGDLTVGGQAITFTDFTFTVDTTTDQLQHVAHGLETGDGPVRVASSVTLPAGLVAGTDYWVINDFGDALRLTTSRINALTNAGQIDITTSGTGTHTLLHQTGTTRVEDATVTRNLSVGGNLTVSGAIAEAARTYTMPIAANGTQTGLVADAVLLTGGSVGWKIQCVGIPSGKTITELRVRVLDSATGPSTLRARLYSSTDGVASAALATTNTSNGSGTEQTLVATGLSIPISALKTYNIIVEPVAGSANTFVHAAALVV